MLNLSTRAGLVIINVFLLFIVQLSAVNSKLYQVDVPLGKGSIIELSSNITITSLPQGMLYQTKDGYTPTERITNVPSVVTSSIGRLIYMANTTVELLDKFEWIMDGINNTHLITVFQWCNELSTALVQPSIKLWYDDSNSMFNFQIIANYLRGGQYQIGFASPNITWFPPCWNRPFNYTDIFGDLQSFAISAPHALFPGALSGIFPAYTVSPLWQVSAVGCGKVMFSTQLRFNSVGGISNLDNVQCTNPLGQDITIQMIDSTPFVKYLGTLSVSFLSPASSYIDPVNPYIRNSIWTQSFTFTFNTVAVAFVSIEYSQDIIPNVVAIYMVGGNLNIIINTQVSNDKYLSNPQPEEPFAFATGAQQLSNQDWQFVSTQNIQNYNSTYTFTWTLNPDNKNIPVSIQITYSNNPSVNENHSFGATLEVYKDANFTTKTVGPFTSIDNIYVLSRLQTYGLSKIAIQQMWICHSSDTLFVPSYDPAKGKYGCKQAAGLAMPVENIQQVIVDGNIVVNYIQKAITNFVNADAISISILPLTGLTATYYIHVETMVQFDTPSSDVSIMHANDMTDVNQNVADALAGIYVVQAAAVGTRLGVGLIVAASAVFVIIIIIVAVIIVVIAIVSRKLDKKKREIDAMLKSIAEKTKDRKTLLPQDVREHIKNGIPAIELFSQQEDMCDKSEHPVNLLQILSDDKWLKKFRDFCSSVHTQESLMFWLAVCDYKLSEGEDQMKLSKDIYNKYIVENAVWQVNLPATIIKGIKQNLDDINIPMPQLFDAARSSILHTMNNDLFERFKASKYFK